jgi:hypothetical protein
MKVEIRPALEEDAATIMQELREIDRESIELLGVSGKPALEQEIVRANRAFTGLVDGKIAVVWGVTSPSLLSNTGFAWMVTSKHADSVPFIFARHSKLELDRLLVDIPVILGNCFAANTRSLKWLRWLGADIAGLKVLKGIPLYPFEFRRA